MEAGLREKIIKLFEYREMPALIKYQSEIWDAQFYEDLIQLQYDIYLLDHELETHWHVDLQVIEQRWVAIHQDLLRLGVPKSMVHDYSLHIYKYQKHELEIRSEKLPTRLSMEYFYYYKSCDVKLLRRLIYDRNPALARQISLGDWRLFDLVTEINDDVEDLQEDTTTINGNRFLISIMQYGKVAAASQFQEYLAKLSERNARKVYAAIADIDIKRWTAEQIALTADMIDAQISMVDSLDLSLYERHLFADA